MLLVDQKGTIFEIVPPPPDSQCYDHKFDARYFVHFNGFVMDLVTMGFFPNHRQGLQIGQFLLNWLKNPTEIIGMFAGVPVRWITKLGPHMIVGNVTNDVTTIFIEVATGHYEESSFPMPSFIGPYGEKCCYIPIILGKIEEFIWISQLEHLILNGFAEDDLNRAGYNGPSRLDDL